MARQLGNTAAWFTDGTIIMSGVSGMPSSASTPEQISARWPSSRQTPLIIATASAGSSTGMEPNPK